MRIGPVDLGFPQVVLVVLAVAVGAAIVVAASTSTASFGVYNPAWDGTSTLRTHADAVGAEPAIVRETAAYDRVPPGESVAVVLSPETPYGPDEADRLRSFVRRGGTLVVAEDFGPHANPLLTALGARARVDGRLLRDERFHYRSPAMPIAPNVSDHPLTDGVDELTLNHGTAVEPNGATVLVATSGYAYLDDDGDGELDDAEALDSYPVATVEPLGAGRVVLVGDPSVLINAMLDRPGNAAFARALFVGSDRALIDVSHAAGLPPLAGLVLAIRGSGAIQVAILAVAIATAWLYSSRPGVLDRLAGPGSAAGVHPPRPGHEAVVAAVERRHPDWDRGRIERVVQGVMVGRGKGGDDG